MADRGHSPTALPISRPTFFPFVPSSPSLPSPPGAPLPSPVVAPVAARVYGFPFSPYAALPPPALPLRFAHLPTDPLPQRRLAGCEAYYSLVGQSTPAVVHRPTAVSPRLEGPAPAYTSAQVRTTYTHTLPVGDHCTMRSAYNRRCRQSSVFLVESYTRHLR